MHAYNAAVAALAAHALAHVLVAGLTAAFVHRRVRAGFVSAHRTLEPRVAALFPDYAAGTALAVTAALLCCRGSSRDVFPAHQRRAAALVGPFFRTLRPARAGLRPRLVASVPLFGGTLFGWVLALAWAAFLLAAAGALARSLRRSGVPPFGRRIAQASAVVGLVATAVVPSPMCFPHSILPFDKLRTLHSSLRAE